MIQIVSDPAMIDAQQWLAKQEGVLAEPSSAASVAGLFDCITRFPDLINSLSEDATIVCTLTGHGLKDPQILMG